MLGWRIAHFSARHAAPDYAPYAIVLAILRKLNADNRGEAIAVAVRLGLVSP
jgi:hypothetical protein